jgi:hypothetical protein
MINFAVKFMGSNSNYFLYSLLRKRSTGTSMALGMHIFIVIVKAARTMSVLPGCSSSSRGIYIYIHHVYIITNNSVVCVRERIIRPSYRRLSVKLVSTFADRGCHVVSVLDPYGRILDFLDWSRYFFFQVAPQLYSRG